MSLLNKILATLAAALGLIAAIFKWRSDAYADKAEQQEQRADRAEALNQRHDTIQHHRAQTDAKQKERQRDEQHNRQAGRRDAFDNDW